MIFIKKKGRKRRSSNVNVHERRYGGVLALRQSSAQPLHAIVANPFVDEAAEQAKQDALKKKDV